MLQAWPEAKSGKNCFYIFAPMFNNTSLKGYLVKIFFVIFFLTPFIGKSQLITDTTGLQSKIDSTLNIRKEDTVLRIKNFSPFFTVHVDSTLDYQFLSNKDPRDYYWYLRKAPVGVRINKDNGTVYFKADKSYFLSGKLQYDYKYNVEIGIQNLDNPQDRLDTSFTLVFYNTDIIPSKIKPTIGNDVVVSEGDTLSFRLQCEDGSFPIEEISYLSDYPINSSTPVAHCGDAFTWAIPYDVIKDNENDKVKTITVKFIGVNKWMVHDTTAVKILVKQSINYPLRNVEFNKVYNEIQNYIVELKRTFMVLDQRIKHTKNNRTAFDLTSASTALGGTIFSSMSSQGDKTAGQILPSVGVALVPVKEAVAPNKSDVQNSATLVRSDIKRLEYLLTDNLVVGDKDPEIIHKTQKLQDELSQVQLQLIDVPVVDDSTSSKKVDEYFNNPRVNKKYRLN
jgi:hypothetical protein